MGPRFRSIRVRLSRRDFSPDGMPVFVRTPEAITWEVYGLYKIYRPTDEEIRQWAEASGYTRLPYATLPSSEWEPESIWCLPRSGVVRTYNPFTDSPELFLQFASLGRSEEPQRDRILKFVHSYGDIQHPYAPFYAENLEWKRGSSVAEFHKEARIAYSALRLYEGIVGQDKDEVKRWIAYIVERWDEFDLRGHKECSLENYRECQKEQGQEIVDCTECDNDPPIEITIAAIRDFLEAASLLLTYIIPTKMHRTEDYLEVIPIMSYRFEYTRTGSIPRFYPLWAFPTLLQAIWALFYLKVTNQIEQEYRICPFCSEPIIKPRRNQVYHEGCRQAKFNQEKREVLRLWRKGKSVEEIAEVTGLELDRIAKWVRKKEGGEGHQNHGDGLDA